MHRPRGCCRFVLLGLAAAGALLVLAALLAQPAEARTITVDDDGPADYDNLQDAVDNASAGDRIFIMPGNYSGLIYSRNDDGIHDIEIIGSSREEVFIQTNRFFMLNNKQRYRNITVSDVTISGLVLENADKIYFDNIIFTHRIRLMLTYNITISNSTFYIKYEGYKGIVGEKYVFNSIFSGNNFISTSEDYRYLRESYGIYGDDFHNVTIENNRFSGQEIGISLLNSDDNVISNNGFLNHHIGVVMLFSIDNRINDNHFEDSWIGISTDPRLNTINGNSYTNVTKEVNDANFPMKAPAPGITEIIIILASLSAFRIRRRRS